MILQQVLHFGTPNPPPNMKPEYKQRVRVIDSTFSTVDITRAMIGQEYELQVTDYVRNLYYVNGLWFNKSDLEFLTPFSFNGVAIAIGDEMKWFGKWYEVYGYCWYDGEWMLEAVLDGDYKSGCYHFEQSEIQDHRKKREADETLKPYSDDQLITELSKRGKFTDGKVIKE